MDNIMSHRTTLVEKTAIELRNDDMREYNNTFSWVGYILTAALFWGFRVDEIYMEQLVGYI